MVMAYGELMIASEQLNFTWNTWMVNWCDLAIVDLLTNLFIKKNTQNYCIFTFDNLIFKDFRQFQKKIFVRL